MVCGKIREVADSRTESIFIRDTACFNFDSLNYELQFIDSKMKMLAVRESVISLKM